MRGSWKATLAPRTEDAWASSSCSSITVDVQIIYGAVSSEPLTSIQRRIEQGLILPSPAWRIGIAGVELRFTDGVCLSGVSLYGNFAALNSTDLAVPTGPLAPVWLGFAGLDLADDDVFTIDGVLHLAVDRPRGLMLAWFAAATEWFSLAEGLLVGIDGAGLVAGFLFQGVSWTK